MLSTARSYETITVNRILGFRTEWILNETGSLMWGLSASGRGGGYVVMKPTGLIRCKSSLSQSVSIFSTFSWCRVRPYGEY